MSTYASQFYLTSEAPKKISNKSTAVFRLGTGTSVVIKHKKKFYLITNHHVYGNKHCAQEGCYGRVIYTNQNSHSQKKVFLKPRALSKDADIAIFQIRKPFLKNYILLSKDEIATNADIHFLGYPRASHLKWSTGRFVNYENKNMLIHAATLPGSSGSAILNANGHLLGIHHSSIKQHNGKNKQHIESWSYSTSSIQIANFIDNNIGLDQFHSIFKTTTFEEALQKDSLYRNAATKPNLLNKEDYFTKLLTKCEEVNTTTRDVDIFKTSTAACQTASHWIDCTRSKKFITHCPTPKEAQRWTIVIKKIMTQTESFHGLSVHSWISMLSRIYSKNDDGQKSAYTALQEHLRRTRPPITPTIANAILMWTPHGEIPTYSSIPLISYILNYKKIPEYPFYALKIAHSALSLKRLNLIKSSIYKSLILELKADSQITTSTKLKLERFSTKNTLT
ncbi:MAG: serine protease [Oligoflexales bacterium]